MLIAVEELDKVETESEIVADFWNLELKEPGCLNARFAVMTVDLYKDVTNEGSIKVELPKNTSSF